MKPVWNAASAGLITLGAVWCWREFRRTGLADLRRPRGETLAFWGMLVLAWLLPLVAFVIQRTLGIHGEFDEFRTVKIFLTAFAAAWVAYRLSLRGMATGATVLGCVLVPMCVFEMCANGFGRLTLGTSPNWIANYGVWLAFALFSLSEFAFARARRRIALTLLAGFAGCALMIAASGSRNGLLVFVVGLGVVFVLGGGRGVISRVRTALAIALTLLVAWAWPNGGLSRAETVVAQGKNASISEVSREMTNGRFEIWQECFKRSEKNNFLVGGGGDSLDFDIFYLHVTGKNGNVHNVLLARWCEYGALGVAGALLMIFSNAVAGVVGIFRSAKMRSTGASDEGRRELWAAGVWNVALSVALFSAGLFEVVPCGRIEVIIVTTTQAFFLFVLLRVSRTRTLVSEKSEI
ncbi:MAG: O-antigen ligase family protein [Candidatus Spyradosoma sp.]